MEIRCCSLEHHVLDKELQVHSLQVLLGEGHHVSGDGHAVQPLRRPLVYHHARTAGDSQDSFLEQGSAKI